MNNGSIKLYNNQEVRVLWDEDNSKWYFCAIDVVAIFNEQNDHHKSSNYWRWLKRKLINAKVQFVSDTHRLKLPAQDRKKYFTDVLNSKEIIELAKHFPNNKSMKFLNWFLYSDSTIAGQSKKKAYSLWESNLISDEEIGTVKALQKIHGYLFGGLFDFAGKIRNVNISKNGFQFAPVKSLFENLNQIEKMDTATIDAVLNQYLEMNLAHPFMDGNGRSTRIWLDLILKKNFQQCLDWSKIGKQEYLTVMQNSVIDRPNIKE